MRPAVAGRMGARGLLGTASPPYPPHRVGRHLVQLINRWAGLPRRPTATVMVSVAVTLVETRYCMLHHQLLGLAPGAYVFGIGIWKRSQWPLYRVVPPVAART